MKQQTPLDTEELADLIREIAYNSAVKTIKHNVGISTACDYASTISNVVYEYCLKLELKGIKT